MSVSKRIIRIVLVLCCLIFAGSVAGLLEPMWAFAFGGPSRSTQALLLPSEPDKDLPQQVSVTMESSTSTFNKGNSDYKLLVELLRVGRTTEGIPVSVGAYPHFGSRKLCGEVAIKYCFMSFHYNLYRSTENQNFLWLKLPKQSGYGTAYPIIIDDGRLSRLIHDAGERQHSQ